MNAVYIEGESIYVSGADILGVNEGNNLNHYEIRCKTEPVRVACSTVAVVWCDSKGDVYEMGNVSHEGETKLLSEPRQVSGLEDIVDIKAGDSHYIALDEKGALWAWGRNDYKQASIEESSTYIDEPVKLSLEDTVLDIECGYYTSAAITENKRAVVWGQDVGDFSKDTEFFDCYYDAPHDDALEIKIGKNHLIVKTESGFFGYGEKKYNALGKEIEKDISRVQFPVKNVQDFACGITSSVFLINGEVYYYGDLNTVDSIEFKKDMCKLENQKNLKALTIKGHDLYVMDQNGNVRKI